MHNEKKKNKKVYSHLFDVWVNPDVEWWSILCVNVNGLELLRSAKHYFNVIYKSVSRRD